jgi:hypothetical protein
LLILLSLLLQLDSSFSGNMDKIQPLIILAAVKLVTYVPLSIVSFVIVYRHGISRGDGWVLLSIFCISRSFNPSMLMILTLLFHSFSPIIGWNFVFPVTFSSYTSLDNGAYALEASGLSPLLLFTLGLLHSMCVHSVGISCRMR